MNDKLVTMHGGPLDGMTVVISQNTPYMIMAQFPEDFARLDEAKGKGQFVYKREGTEAYYQPEGLPK